MHATPAMRTLVLFDIDATLISTSRSGVHAMRDAGRELFRPDFTTERTEFSGRLDPLILADLLAHNAVPVTSDNLRAMRDAYKKHLVRRLAVPGIARTLPGVDDLTRALWGMPDTATGLLTGNFEDTGRIKLQAAGIEHHRFHVAVWGTDSPHEPPSRDHLPPVGLARFRARFGHDIDSGRVTIIGDTPHDVRCAVAAGCRSIAVATGMFSTARLHEAGADLVVETLADTAHLLDFMMT
jgi:phosphoglycolate phosphatase-like HAD superfamily hydrolase